MKKILYIFLSVIIIACSKEEHDLTVKVSVSGLKKGVLYLKKIKSKNLITVDSVAVNGQSDVELHATSLESPEVFYLFLDKNSSEKDQIKFFADKGVTEIKTSVKSFGFSPKINGSPQQKIYENYNLYFQTIKKNES